MFQARRLVMAGLIVVVALLFDRAAARVSRTAVLFLDFAESQNVQLVGAHHERISMNGWLSFNSATQFAEAKFSGELDGIKACSIGGWFFIQRRGEQVL